MVYDDYLIRMIRQGAAVLARVIGLKKSGSYPDALQEIDRNLEQLFGLDDRLLRLLDDESLYHTLSSREEITADRLEFAADLFKEEGEILQLQGKPEESDAAYGRSLSLFIKLENLHSPSPPAAASQKIEEILDRMNASRLSDPMLFEVFCRFENECKYAKAEGILNLLASRPAAATDACRERKLFYQRLLILEPGVLSAQGMSRKYLHDRLKELA
jgi:hypothetical protein